MDEINIQKPMFASRRMEQQWNRMQDVKIVRSGLAAQDVTSFFGVSTRSVLKWLTGFIESGQNGLLAKDGAGRPSKVSAE
jgi:transposase